MQIEADEQPVCYCLHNCPGLICKKESLNFVVVFRMPINKVLLMSSLKFTFLLIFDVLDRVNFEEFPTASFVFRENIC